MSKSVTKYLSLATLGLLAVSVTPQLASAATTQSYGTQGEVTFTAGTDTTGPVDPQDPTVPVKPTEPDGVNPCLLYTSFWELVDMWQGQLFMLLRN